MTPTARIPDVLRRARPATLVALALLAAAGLAGCSQEGKTIQNALPVPGIAYDVTEYTTRNDTVRVGGVVNDTLSSTVVIMSVQLKLQTVYYNLCEARGGLELRAIGDVANPVYLVTPLARYTADEDCNVGASGDTLQTITVRDLIIRRPLWQGVASDVVFARMQVASEGAPTYEFDVRHDLATPRADSTLYDITVQDATTGLALDGALVSVQEYGTPNILGEGTTAGGGKFSFSVAYGDEAGSVGDPYIVKVSYAGRITLFRALDFPSLSKRREAIIVRV